MVAGLIGSVFLVAVGIYYVAVHHAGGVFLLVIGAFCLLFFLVRVPLEIRRGKI